MCIPCYTYTSLASLCLLLLIYSQHWNQCSILGHSHVKYLYSHKVAQWQTMKRFKTSRGLTFAYQWDTFSVIKSEINVSISTIMEFCKTHGLSQMVSWLQQNICGARIDIRLSNPFAWYWKTSTWRSENDNALDRPTFVKRTSSVKRKNIDRAYPF